MGELILPGDEGFSGSGWRDFRGQIDRLDYEQGRVDAHRVLCRMQAEKPWLTSDSIDFTIDQGPSDEPVSRAYVAGARSVIPTARVVWNDGAKITVIDEGQVSG